MLNIVSRLESWSEGNDIGGYDDISREFQRALRLEASGESVAVAFTVTFRGKDRAALPTSSGNPSLDSISSKPGPTDYQVGLFRDHGIRPSALQRKIRSRASFQSVLRSYVKARVGHEVKLPIVRLEMHLFPTPVA